MEYKTLAEAYQAIENTSKRLEKTSIISDLLKQTKQKEISKIILLLQGRVFPNWDKTSIGIASKLVVKAINKATGIDTKKIIDKFKKTGDLGLVAEQFTKKKTQATLFSESLTVEKVFKSLKKIPTIEGTGSVDKKMQIVSELLTSASPLEAKYIVRTVLEELRVGISKGTLRDAIGWAFLEKKLNFTYKQEYNIIELEDRDKYNQIMQLLQDAFDLTNDFTLVTTAAINNTLHTIKPEIGKPINPMLCRKEKNIEEAFKRTGKPAQFEYKYDGFRMQIHKANNTITLFTRNLENITTQFPEVVDIITTHVKGNSFIIDGEAVGFDAKTGKAKPFQHISQRIKRKYDIQELAKKIPVEINLFDILHYEGKNLLKTPLQERMDLLKKIIKEETKKIVFTKSIITDDDQIAQQFYDDALEEGMEGIIVKDLKTIYKPGGRIDAWIKLKPVMEPLDLVIVEAEWGEGKRSGWFTSFVLACRDEEGNLLTIGKVGTGVKEKKESDDDLTFEELTVLLKPLIEVEEGRTVKVKPNIVLEINYEEIQKSPSYTSGYALRFPRVIRNRTDERDITNISDLELVEEFYFAQK